MDFVFFAGDAEETKKHWMAARKAGAGVVDLTNALEGEPGVVVRGPLAVGGPGGCGARDDSGGERRASSGDVGTGGEAAGQGRAGESRWRRR